MLFGGSSETDLALVLARNFTVCFKVAGNGDLRIPFQACWKMSVRHHFLSFSLLFFFLFFTLNYIGPRSWDP